MARIDVITNRLNALNGADKVAIVLLAVGNEHAGKLVERLEPDEQREVVRALAGMGLVSADVVERLLNSFMNGLDRPTVYGSIAQAEQILMRALPPDQVRQMMEDIAGPAGRNTWERLHSVPDSQMAAFLRAESPQTSAFVITKLPPVQAARVLQQLPRPTAEDIVRRLVNLTPVAKPIVEDVERVLRSEFLVNIGQNRAADNHAVVAEIMNQLDSELEGTIFESLDRDMPESAERIRRLMFTFDDLEDIDDAGINILLREIPNGILPVALKNARPEMQELFLRNMAERAARMMREEMAAMPKVRLREVEDARRQIINVCKQLMQRGEIAVAGEEEADWVG